jgi:hypothetical protein
VRYASNGGHDDAFGVGGGDCAARAADEAVRRVAVRAGPLPRARGANAGASAAARAALRKRSRDGCVPAGDATLHGTASPRVGSAGLVHAGRPAAAPAALRAHLRLARR